MALSTRHLFAAVLFIALFAMTARNVTDPDFGWHLRTGEIILSTGSVPETDVFSLTAAGEPRIAHDWLVDAVMYLLFQGGGYFALVLFFGLAATLTFILLYFRCAGRPYIAGFVVVLAAMAAAPFWGVRPQTISLLLTSIFLVILDRYGRSGAGRFLLWLVPLTLVWANSHGSFILGPVLILVYLAGDIAGRMIPARGLKGIAWQNPRALFGILILCVLVIAINPVGIALYRYPLETVNSSVIQTYIQEWQSPDFHALEIQPFALMLILALVALGYRGRRSGLVETMLVIALAVASLRQARQISLFVLVAAPVIAAAARELLSLISPSLARSRPSTSSRSRTALNLVLLAAFAVAALLRVGSVLADQPRAEQRYYPVAAVDFILERNLSGPLLNRYDWGGYLIWKLYPRERVFIDGRSDLYGLTGDRVVKQYFQSYLGSEGWREPLDAYKIRLALISPDAPLASLLNQEPEWKKVYEDEQAAIYSKQ
jgi:hypothetical protein